MGCPLLAVWKLVVILIRVIGVETLAGRWEVSVLCLWRPSRNIAALTTPEVLTNKPQLRTLQPRGRVRWRTATGGSDWRWLRISQIYISVGLRTRVSFMLGQSGNPFIISGQIFLWGPGTYSFHQSESFNSDQIWKSHDIFQHEMLRMGQIERDGARSH